MHYIVFWLVRTWFRNQIQDLFAIWRVANKNEDIENKNENIELNHLPYRLLIISIPFPESNKIIIKQRTIFNKFLNRLYV